MRKQQHVFKGSASRLPPLTATLALLAVSWEVQRDLTGQDTCNTTLVGAYRRKLGPLTLVRPTDTMAEITRDNARAVLARICDSCPFGRCPMKKWGIRPPSV
jgi:hypothetical protein